MLGFGFGFVEVGTLTPRPQAGNPKPRLFRLAEDEAVDQPHGLQQSRPGRRRWQRLRARRDFGRAAIVGVNIGANKDSADRIADYVAGRRGRWRRSPTISPSTSPRPTRRGCARCRTRARSDELLAAVMAARGGGPTPVFLKVAPDLEPDDIDDIVRGGDPTAGSTR